MKFLYGHPLHYTEDGDLVGIHHLIRVKDWDAPILCIPVMSTVAPKLIITDLSEPIPQDLLRYVEYRLRDVNSSGVATYEFARYEGKLK